MLCPTKRAHIIGLFRRNFSQKLVKPDFKAKNTAHYAIFIAIVRGIFGAPAGTRILDPLIKSQMLYQLSYGHIYLAVSQP